MAITAFDKQVFAVLRPEIDAALKAVGEKHGITLKMGRASFSADIFSAKLEGAISDGSKSVSEIKFEKDYKNYASLYSLPVEGLGGRMYTGGVAGKVYICAGLKLKRGGWRRFGGQGRRLGSTDALGW